MLNHKIKITPRSHGASCCDYFAEAVNDANGNRTQLQIGAPTTTYSYRLASNVMTNLNGSGVITDAVGNTTSLRGMTLTYDTLNRLQTVNGASYTYNALNQRTQKVAGGNTTSYVYGLSGELLAEAANDGITEYVYLHGAPMAMVKQGNVYYIHDDHLGTPRAMTGSTRKVVWRWDSDPFGATAANEDPDNDGVKVTLNLRFPGQYFDQESGFFYNWNRYYDPLSGGRYITSDPIGLAGGLNTFGYVFANPLKYIDRDGLVAWFGIPLYIWATGGAVAGGTACVATNCGQSVVDGVSAVYDAIPVYVPNSAADDTGQPIPDSAADDSKDKPYCPPVTTKTDDGDKCYKNYENDLSTCRAIGRLRGAVKAEACYASAIERLAACTAGKSIPPLNTWNN